MVVEGGFGDNDATIGGATGAVIRSGRLTLIVGDSEEPFAADDQLPIEALRTADRLAAEGSWEFDDVASALHQLVVDHDPAGVAALLDGDIEAMVFLFDQAGAVELDPDDPEMANESIDANGRTGWTTELVSGPLVKLQLRGSSDSVAWTALRSGLVPGDSAIVPVTSMEEAYPEDLETPDPEPIEESLDLVEEPGGTDDVDPKVDLGVDLDDESAIGDHEAIAPTEIKTADERKPAVEDTDADSADADPDRDTENEDELTPAQRTMVVDPSQIGLTRLSTDEQPPAPAPPPPGPARVPTPHSAPPPGSPPPPGSRPAPPLDVLPPAPDAPTTANPVNLPPPPATPATAVPLDAPPPAAPPPTAPPPSTASAATALDPATLDAPSTESSGPGALPPPAASIDLPPPGAPPPSAAGPDVAVPAPPGPSGPPVNLPPPPRGPGGLPRPPASNDERGAGAESWTPTPPPPGFPAPPPPGAPPSPGQPPDPTPPAQEALSAPPAPGRAAPSGRGLIGFLIDQAGGERHAISGTTVVGSDPAGDAEVVIGAATMITVEDQSVHEVHVRIKVSGHSVSVEDAGFGDAWLQDSGGPMEMLDSTPKPLNPGSQLRLGSKTFVFRPATGPGS